MDLPAIERFAGAANQTFDLAIGEGSMALTLVEVRPLPIHRGAPAAMRQPFALTFRSASPVVLPQRIYQMANATLGKLGIFIVPVGRDASSVLYQAIFN